MSTPTLDPRVMARCALHGLVSRWTAPSRKLLPLAHTPCRRRRRRRRSRGAATFDVTVTTQAGCVWSAAPVAASPFITLNSGSPGSGTGTARFNVDANPGAARNGTVRIAWSGESADRSISQAGADCTYSVSPASPASVGAGAATFDVTVTTQAGCAWSAAPVAASPFITLNSGSSQRDRTVKFNVDANPGAARNGTVRIAWSGESVDRSISQAAGCRLHRCRQSRTCRLTIRMCR